MENNDIAVLSSNSHQPGIESITGSVCSVCLNDLRQIAIDGAAVEILDYEELLSKYLKAKFGEEENRPPSQYFGFRSFNWGFEKTAQRTSTNRGRSI
jgi:hypothetical protein